MRRDILAVLAVGSLSLCACASGRRPAAGGGAARPELEFLTPYGPTTRPFSPAVRVGNLLFLAGQVGTAPNAGGGVVPGGIEAETRQVLENIKDVLQKSGSSMDRVVKCTVFMADM